MKSRENVAEDEGSALGDVAVSQGTPRRASKPPEAGKRAWSRHFLTALRGNQPV